MMSVHRKPSSSVFSIMALIWVPCLLLLTSVPALGVTFYEDTYIGPDDDTYDNEDIIVDGCTLTVDGAHPFNSLQVINGGVVTHSANADTQVTTLDLIIAADVTIEAGSKIDVSARGFASSEGPGAGADGSFAAGAGYGGRGGLNRYWTGAGEAYGSIAAPTDIGSGGGYDTDHGRLGGAGGGAVRLDVAGTVTVEGQILANGADGAGYDAGGGSGGTVYITAGTLAGSGVISAVGGVGAHATNAGCGAGGRVALEYDSSSFSGSITAVGGSSDRSGAAGTIYTKLGAAAGSLLIDAGNHVNVNRTPLDSQTPAADTQVTNGASVECSEAVVLASLDVDANCRLHPPAGTGFELTVEADLALDPNAHISAAGHGYPSSEGPGEGGDGSYASGGGHGGNGGASVNGIGGGGPYGSITEPTTFGSGGGRDTDHGKDGGAGGGAIHIIVNGTFTCDGEVNADGLVGTQNDAGGGAGGSIWIEAATLAGTGAIHANGGPGYYQPNAGGGGGGRVAVYTDSSSFSGSITAYGAAGAQYGGAGTVYAKASGDAYGTTLIDNGGNAGGLTRMFSSLWPMDVDFNLELANAAWVWADDPMTFVNLSIDSGAVLSHEGTQNVFDVTVLEDATVTLDGTISADGCGHPSQSGQGAGGDASYAGGAGYGGRGGNGLWGAGGAAYGAITDPSDLGSGGGRDTDHAAAGGSGGGAIRLAVVGTLTLDGEITADGFEGTNYDAGGGSGGTVNLNVGTLGGSGLISADGGAGHHSTNSGGGAGGRIAVYYGGSTFGGGMTACGNTGTVGGGAGTIYTQQGALTGSLVIDACGATNIARTPLDGESPAADTHVSGGARVEISEATTLNSLDVTGSSILWPPSQQTLELTVSGNVSIEAGSAISADAHGFGPSDGPGAGGDGSEAGGGGYGGTGGAGNSGLGGVTYGSITAPIDLGSGGGNDTNHGYNGGAGGGAIMLTVGGELTVDGEITADGAIGDNYEAGGGSGGSIWLDAAMLAGSGAITADGGPGRNEDWAGGGGGGRVAIYYDNSTFAGLWSAYGGNGRQYGGAGTVYAKASGDTYGTVLIDNASNAGGLTRLYSALWPSGDVTFDLDIDHAAFVYADDAMTFASLDVTNAAQLGHEAAQNTFAVTVLGDAIVDLTSFIHADGRGFPSSEGPGGGSDGSEAGGGGYGGVGGRGESAAGGGVYGSIDQPTDLGSGGGYDTNNARNGGAGGGALKLIVGGTFTVDGVVSADGVPGANYEAGGGSGGSIWLDVGALDGTGAIHADGGQGANPGYAGGGAGGRIAIYYDTNTFSGVWTAYGGQGFQYGGAGTIYTRGSADPHATVLIDNGGNVGGLTRLNSTLWTRNAFDLNLANASWVWVDDPMTFQNLSVDSQAVLSHEPGSMVFEVTVLDDALVMADGAIVANACGHPSSTGPGEGGDGSEAGGAGYGGAGGNGYSASGGDAYGEPIRAYDLGSGGGRDTNHARDGGAGGGAILLKVGDLLTVDGIISADGAAGTGSQAGGGSGGGVALKAGAIDGAGQITANGGAGAHPDLAGGGAGGRIALFTCDLTMPLEQITATGGTGYQDGEDGTIFFGSGTVEILVHPLDQRAYEGDPVTFTVVASGDGQLSYQWRKDGIDLVDDERISGATTDTLTIDPVVLADAGHYDVLVTDDCGPFPSNSALLIVPPDLNGDGCVDQSDLGILLADYGCTGGDCPGDCNGDGETGHSDLGILLAHWGQGCP